MLHIHVNSLFGKENEKHTYTHTYMHTFRPIPTGGVGVSQPKILSANQPNFQLCRHVGLALYSRSDNKVTTPSSLFWYHYSAKRSLVTFIAKLKGVVSKGFLVTPPPKPSLFFLSNYAPSQQLHVVSTLPCSDPKTSLESRRLVLQFLDSLAHCKDDMGKRVGEDLSGE